MCCLDIIWLASINLVFLYPCNATDILESLVFNADLQFCLGGFTSILEMMLLLYVG